MFFISCGGNQEPGRRSHIYNLDDSEEVPLVKDKIDESLTPLVIIDDSSLIDYGEETIKEIKEETGKPIRTKKFYCELLDAFCKKFFDRKFQGTTYIAGSINVDNVAKVDENTVEVRGTHSFNALLIRRNNKGFIASIRDDGNNNYHIDFQRKGVLLKGNKNTRSLPFYYNPEE